MKKILLIFLFLQCSISFATTKTQPLDINYNLTFIVVEQTNSRGDMNRFSVSQEALEPDSTVQSFSMILPNILSKDLASITGVIKIGDSLWTFVDQSIVNISGGKLIVHTKINVKNGETGTAKLISKEPYKTIKVVGNTEQNVIEFIEVGITISAKPKFVDKNTVCTAIELKLSEVLRESGEERETTVPVTSLRDLTTSVDLTMMQLEVLGELSIDKKVNVEKGIPFLRNIPLLGKLIFSTTEDHYYQTKLYIVGGINPTNEADIENYKELRKEAEKLINKRFPLK